MSSLRSYVIGLQVAEAPEVARQHQLVHGGILVDAQGRVKVLDLGLTTHSEKRAPTRGELSFLSVKP